MVNGFDSKVSYVYVICGKTSCNNEFICMVVQPNTLRFSMLMSRSYFMSTGVRMFNMSIIHSIIIRTSIGVGTRTISILLVYL